MVHFRELSSASGRLNCKSFSLSLSILGFLMRSKSNIQQAIGRSAGRLHGLASPPPLFYFSPVVDFLREFLFLLLCGPTSRRVQDGHCVNGLPDYSRLSSASNVRVHGTENLLAQAFQGVQRLVRYVYIRTSCLCERSSNHSHRRALWSGPVVS